MAASVGGVTCDFVRGAPASLKQRTQTWFTPGINGQWALRLGFNDAGFSFMAVLYDTESAVKTWRTSIEALQGTVVTIVDDFAESWAHLLVVSVSPFKRSTAIGQKSGVGYTTRGEIVVSGVVVS